MAVFESEVYWGTPQGALLHDTIEVEAVDFAEAEMNLLHNRPIPSRGYDSCARREYFEGYFDVEFLNEVSIAE